MKAGLAVLGITALLLTHPAGSRCADAPLRLATFRADVTPPIGDGPCVGFMPKIATIEHPLEIRGIVLQSAGGTFVVAAIDYQGLCNSSDEFFRQSLADAAGTTVDRVALQSLHQHTAPVLDVEAVRLLYGDGSKQLQQHQVFTAEIAGRAALAVREALPRAQPLVRIVASRAKVDRVASNRRIPLPDGRIAVRSSSTRDPKLQAAPEGLIDPWLRTLTFVGPEKPLAQIHYYATHPMSFYGDARISWDIPGIARQRLETESGIFQVYFNACGGNIGMGKYNDGSLAAREVLAGRVVTAMKRASELAVQAVKPESGRPADETGRVDAIVTASSLTVDDVNWDTVPLRFTLREDGPFDSAAVREQLQAEQPFNTRLKAAMFSAWAERLRKGHSTTLSRLKLGTIQIVHLPGEPFVEFQLFAQQVADQSFVCIAGYGECGVWYYGPDSIYQDRGGYEQTWSFTGPCQQSVERALIELLASHAGQPARRTDEQRRQSGALKRGQQAPQIDAVAPDGNALLPEHLAGKTVLLTFYSMHWKSTPMHFSELRRLRHEFLHAADFQILSVCMDDAFDQWLRFLEKHPVLDARCPQRPFYSDSRWWQMIHHPADETRRNPFRVRSQPASFLIGPDGRVLDVEIPDHKLRDAITAAFEIHR